VLKKHLAEIKLNYKNEKKAMQVIARNRIAEDFNLFSSLDLS